MATPNKDAAKEVYTPDHQTRTFTSGGLPEADPSLATDGTDCSKYNVLTFFRHHNASGTSQYELWYYDNIQWFVYEDSSTLAVADYDPTADHFMQHYNVVGVYRYKLVMQSSTVDGRVTENLQI